MKRYEYLVSTNLTSRQVMAEKVEVTTNGELIFMVGVGDDIVAAAAPGYWLRFWEVDDKGNEIKERNREDDEREDSANEQE